MHKDDFVIYGIVLVTSTTTILTMVDGTLLGLLRGIAFAVILDGFVIMWEHKSETLDNKKQRDLANAMKWAGVGVLLVIAIAYIFVSFVPVDAVQKVDLFGMVIASTIRDMIHWSIVGLISAWTVLTLGILLRMREIDPSTIKKIELSAEAEAREKEMREAHRQREREEMQAYKIALTVTNRKIGTERALRIFRENLEKMECYSPVQIDAMINEADMEIKAQRGENIPVNIPAQAMNTYQQTAQAVDPNFINPSTAQTKK